MRILLDTNIFIYREEDRLLADNLRDLLKTLSKIRVETLIHPLSLEELKKYKDEKRRDITLSKVGTYSTLELPPDPKKDQKFIEIIANELEIDDYILYAVYKDAVDFLITEDRGIYKKAGKLGMSDRVLLIDEGRGIFENYLHKGRVFTPPALKEDFVYNLNFEDPIFYTLKQDYPNIKDWFEKKSREGRKCWVHHQEDGSIGALLIYKFEDEPIEAIPPLPKNKRFKISTFVVSNIGYKIGELFIKLSIDLSIRNGLFEIYLTHFTKSEDRLVDLISEYGFLKVGINKNGEDIYLKKLTVISEEIADLHPLDLAKRYYPSFYDGEDVRKFIIPIQPEYHNRLFTDFEGRQTKVNEHLGEFIVEGNTIKKAYLSHSRITKMRAGDVILFYRSIDQSKITSIGVIESVFKGIVSVDELTRIVGKRTVYNHNEIEDFVQKPTTVILFLHHFHLKNPLSLNRLEDMGVLSSAPQSIIEITNEKYNKIKRNGEINEHFTVH